MSGAIDWGWWAFVTLLVLNLLYVGAWKPFLAAYMGKKGERLATSEDIEKILREVRLVTSETEAIKARVSGELWDTQSRWNAKHQAYLHLLENLGESMTSAHNAAHLIVLKQRGKLPKPGEAVLEKHAARIQKLQFEMSRIGSAATLSVSNPSIEVLNEFGSRTARLDPHSSTTAAELETILLDIRNRLVRTARADLGYPPIDLRQHGPGSPAGGGR